GVGLAHSMLPGNTFGSGVNWAKAGEVGLSLLVSPLLGFCLAAGLLWLLLRWFPDPELHHPPEKEKPPPWWIRLLLIGTCTGVSFAHGSNDGQKGIGLMMLILIGLVPAQFALNLAHGDEDLQRTVQATNQLRDLLRDPDVRLARAAAEQQRARSWLPDL